MDADRKVGWTFKRPYLVFEPILWWRLLGTSVESSSCISVSGLSPGWRLHLWLGISTYFVFSSGPWARTVSWLPTLGRALNPAAYSGDSTRDRETDSSICDLSFLIILLFLLHYYCIHYTFAHIEHFSPFLADNSQYYAPYVSLKPGMKYSIIVTPARTYRVARTLE